MSVAGYVVCTALAAAVIPQLYPAGETASSACWLLLVQVG